jgi:excisionase family DNA binding protein
MSAERLLTPEEAAERLGLSPVTVGHMLRRGELPGVKVGRLWRFREAALDEYIRGLEAPELHKGKNAGKPPAPKGQRRTAPNAADKANATRGPAGRSEASRKANATRKERARGDGS